MLRLTVVHINHPCIETNQNAGSGCGSARLCCRCACWPGWYMVRLQSRKFLTIQHVSYKWSTASTLEQNCLIEDLYFTVRPCLEVTLVKVVHTNVSILPSGSIRGPCRMHSDPVLNKTRERKHKC